MQFLDQHFSAILGAIVLLAFMWLVSREDSVVGRFILALNSLNTPMVAVLVIVLGEVYGIVCNQYGMKGDGPSTIIGAGIGLLTGQVLSKTLTQTHDGQPPQVSQTTGAPTATETFQQPKK